MFRYFSMLSSYLAVFDHRYAGTPNCRGNSGSTGAGHKPPGVRKAASYPMGMQWQASSNRVCAVRRAGRHNRRRAAGRCLARIDCPIRSRPEVRWQIAPAVRVPVRLAGLARGKSKLRTCRNHRRARMRRLPGSRAVPAMVLLHGLASRRGCWRDERAGSQAMGLDCRRPR
jgi:hypothetical protein